MKTGIRTNTERKIIDAVFELIENNPKSKISVRDIYQKATISKNTFYTYFNGIDDLFDNIVDEAEKLLADELISDERPFDELYFTPLLSRLYKKRKIYKNLILQIKTFPVKRFLFDVYIEQITSTLNDRGIKDEEEILYHFTYIQSGIIICISNWLNQGCKESPQDLSRILYDCITQKEYKT